jgi:glycosyltransferase involved in cell wall biosynthesis
MVDFPQISVALGSHNGSRFIEAQLRSILEQTVLPNELVLSDDASHDDTVQIAERLVSGTRMEMHVMRNLTPLGVTANFAQAMTSAHGELVILADQDDIWHPERVAKAAQLMTRRPDLQFVHSDARLVDAAGRPFGSLLDSLGVRSSEREEIHRGSGLDVLLRRNVVTGATMMLRRGLVELALPFPAEWVHDEWLAIVGSITGAFELIDEPLVDYRQHGANQIGAHRLTLRERLSKLREPRQERNENLVARATVLLAKARALGDRVAPATLADIEGLLGHERLRLGYPESRLARVPRVFAVGPAKYRRFSRGASDMLRDLTQPAGDARLRR